MYWNLEIISKMHFEFKNGIFILKNYTIINEYLQKSAIPMVLVNMTWIFILTNFFEEINIIYGYVVISKNINLLGIKNIVKSYINIISI